RLESAARSARLCTPPPPGTPQAPGVQLWHDVYEGKGPLVAHPNTPAAPIHLLQATRQYKLMRLGFFLSREAVAETVPALKERKVLVILRPGFDLLPNSRDRFSAARMLHEAGVEFAFSLTARPTAVPPVGPAGVQPADDPIASTTIDPDFPLF